MPRKEMTEQNQNPVGRKFCWCCGAGLPNDLVEELLGAPRMFPYQWKILVHLYEKFGQVVRYESFPSTVRNERLNLNQLKIHLCRLREVMADVGSTYFIETVFPKGLRRAHGLRLVKVTPEKAEKLYSLSSGVRYHCKILAEGSTAA